MDLNEQCSRLSVELLTLAAVHFTAIVSQPFSECDDNRVSIICSGLLRPAFWCFVPWSAAILRQQPLKWLFGKPLLFILDKRFGGLVWSDARPPKPFVFCIARNINKLAKAL